MASRGISTLLALASVLALLMAAVHCQPPPGKSKVTNLHFFFHDTVVGKNRSAVLAAKPQNISSGVQESFGRVVVIDDPLTEGPLPNSKVLGSAQGFYVFVGRRTTLMLTLGADYGSPPDLIKAAPYSVFSRNPVMETERELAVVGGPESSHYEFLREQGKGRKG